MIRGRLDFSETPFWACFPFTVSQEPSTVDGRGIEYVLQSGSDVIVVDAPVAPGEAEGSFLEQYEITQNDISAKLGHCSILNNINRSQSLESAVWQAEAGYASTGSSLMKIEMLDSDKEPRDRKVIELVKRLRGHDLPFRVLPLITASVDTAQECERLGCDAVRVLAGSIGSGSGVRDNSAIVRIREAVSVPLVLEGGISLPEQVADCFELGADYVLASSVFKGVVSPGETANHLQRTARECWAGRKDVRTTREQSD